MSTANIKLTPLQVEYNQHLTNQSKLRDDSLNRITAIRKEVNALHLEEAKLEEIVQALLVNIQ